MRNSVRRWFAWWYLAIAAGYVLLAAATGLRGGTKGAILLRLAIAAGFSGLAVIEFRGLSRK